MIRMDEEMVINPVLMLAISRMRENDTPDTRDKMLKAMLEAKFLVPCLIQMKPGTETETKRDTTNTVVNFNMLKTTDGQMYFLAFTDMDSLKKWQDNPNQNGMVMRFEDIADLVLRAGDKSAGFVLNPKTTSLAFQSAAIADIMKNRKPEHPEGAVQAITPEAAADILKED